MSSILTSGAAVTAIGGSIKNITFQRNQWGSYVRSKPVNNTGVPWLSGQQALIAFLVEMWQNTLTDAERYEWINATGYTKNKVSKRIALKGYQLFLRTNLNISLALGSFVTVPSPQVALYIPGSISSVISTAFATVTWSPVATVGGWFIVFYCSPYLSAGRMSPVQAYAFIARAAVNSLTANIAPDIIALRGAAPTGARIWLKVLFINSVTGQRTPPYYLTGIFG